MSMQNLHQTTDNLTYDNGIVEHIISQAISMIQEEIFLLALGLQIHVQTEPTEANFDLKVKAEKIELIRKTLQQLIHMILPSYQYN